MIDDPWFYIAAVPAVLIAGIGKGGFGGAMGMLATPLMALTISPVQAAAIMLPILCVMDLQGAWVYRKGWHRRNLIVLASGAVVGILFGALTFSIMDVPTIQVMIGLIAVIFALNNWFNPLSLDGPPRTPKAWWGRVCGFASGFTSFVAHAGGPPVTIYMLPQRLDRRVFQATTVMFFIIVNYVKLIPYSLLGQFDTANLSTSAVLLPLAPIGMALGIWLHKRVSGGTFVRIINGFLFLTGLKLLYDGLTH